MLLSCHGHQLLLKVGLRRGGGGRRRGRGGLRLRLRLRLLGLLGLLGLLVDWEWGEAVTWACGNRARGHALADNVKEGSHENLGVCASQAVGVGAGWMFLVWKGAAQEYVELGEVLVDEFRRVGRGMAGVRGREGLECKQACRNSGQRDVTRFVHG